jgi:DNA-binding NarL/FixJ family response regulator
MAMSSSSSSRSTNQPQQFGMAEADEAYMKRLTKWIVVVDDEESIRTAVGQYLSNQGYRVTACEDAESAYEVCTTTTDIPGKKRSSGTLAARGGLVLPDAIVSDIRMPGGMDGIEFLEQIRNDSLLQGVPVVLLTAKGMTQDRIVGYQAGADAYLPKPFSPEELVSILDNVIERFEILNGERIEMDELQKDVQQIKNMVLGPRGGRAAASSVSSQQQQQQSSYYEEEVFFTTDERFVLSFVVQGLTNKEIASQMELSQSRIEQHLTSMFRKANVVNRTELVRWAIAQGLSDL